MQSDSPNALHPTEQRHMQIYAVAWQSTIVLSFLGVFWGLAWISPWTDKSQRSTVIGGAVILALLWVLAVVLTLRTRERRPLSVRRFIRENPQIWIVAVYLLLSARDITVIPMCDNGAYFKSILDAVRRFNFGLGDNLTAMKLNGHPAQGFAAYMMLGQFVDYTAFQIANIQTRILFVAGVLGFSGIVNYLFPGRGYRFERLLATALFAFTPLVYGLSLTISPDFGVLVFLCLTLYCIMRRHSVLAAAFGVMLCFTKEAGALLYASLLVGIFAIKLPYLALRGTGPRIRNFATSVLRHLHLAIPLVLYAAYLVVDGQLWIFSGPQAVVARIGSAPIDSSTVYDKSVQIFLANFNWLVWGMIGLGLLAWFYRRWRRQLNTPATPDQGVWFVLLAFTLIPFTLVNYAFVTWNNARYILPISLFVILFLIKALQSSLPSARLRLGLLSICLGLFFISCFRTIDPLLLRLFTTFRFGDHRMSFYNSQATVCDLSFYNREYVYYNRLFDQFLRESRFDPTQDEFVFFTQDVYWSLANHNIAYLWTGNNVTGPLYVDRRTLARTYDAVGNPGLKSSIFVRGSIDESQLPLHAYSIQLFWIRKLRDLSDKEMRDYYDVVREIHVEEDGYSLDGYELTRRN